MKVIRNSSTSTHSEWFFCLCGKADEIVMASPFCYSDFADFANSVKGTGFVGKVVFITTAKNDEIGRKIDSLLSFRKEMERIGVQWVLRVDNRLHGKIYIFKNSGQPFAGIITSANLTHNGMIVNHEFGVQIDDVPLLEKLETQLVASALDILSAEQLAEIKDRVQKQYLSGIQEMQPTMVIIDDIVHGYKVPEGIRIFIKPVGVSTEPPPTGDFATATDMYFSTRYPRAVRIGDILIAYAVGNRRIIGAYTVTSKPIWKENGYPRWPWYVTSDCLTPNLSNCKWEKECLFVTQIANNYVNDFNQPLTYAKGKTLGALNRGSDKVRLDNNYGHYLLSMVLDSDGKCK